MTEPSRVLLLAEVSPADTYYVDVQPHGSEALPIPPPPQALRREVWTAVVVGNAFGLAAMVSVYMLWSTGSTGWFVAYLAVSVVIAAIANVAPTTTRLRQRRRDLAWAAHLHELALRDELTGLANRRMLNDVLVEAVAQPAPLRARRVLAIVDIDDFKRVNDLHGHAAGDAALIAIARALQSGATTPGDLVARIGGDEFAVLATLPADHSPESFAARLSSLIGESQGEGSPSIGASVGVVPVSGHATTDHLLRAADARMYSEKARHAAARPKAS